MKIVTDATFEAEVMMSTNPVLIDFFATWCGPCQAMVPVLESFAAQCPSIRVVKINVEESPIIASRFHVRSIPTLVLIRQGKTEAIALGAKNESELKKWVEEHLGVTL